VEFKNIVVLVSILILLIPLATAGLQQTSEASSPQITATLQSQTPDPVEPGQFVTVKFKIENQGKETKNDVKVKLIQKYPFSLVDGDGIKSIGKLRAGSTGADAVVVTYKIKVDENAVEDDTELELEIHEGSSTISYTDEEFLIDIRTEDAVLDITSIKSEPSQIAPGEMAKVHITVKNLADSLLRDIKFKLDFDDDDMPLAPYQSSSERRISQLKRDFQDSLTFSIIAAPDATPGLYKVPVTITYNDDRANSFTISDILAVTVGDTPKVRPYIKKSNVMKKGTPGKLTLGLANAGTNDVKFVELFLLPSEDYELISTSDYFYIGDIDSDDTESEEIDIYVSKKADSLKVPVRLKYFDANNKEFQQQFNLEMNLYSSFQLKRFGIEEPGNLIRNLFFLLLIIGGIYYYRTYYKKPERNLSQDLKSLYRSVFHRKKRR